MKQFLLCRQALAYRAVPAIGAVSVEMHGKSRILHLDHGEL